MQQQQTNGMAITSLVISVLAWLIALLLACFNFVVLPVITVATLGLGAGLYVCTGAIGLLSPIGWVIAVVTGNTAANQIKQTGAGGEGIAKAGVISAYVGLGLTALLICGLLLLFLLSAMSGANLN